MRRGGRQSWEGAPICSQFLIDVAAGRPISRESPISDEVLTAASRHGLLGLMASSENPLLSRSARPAYARLAARQQVMERVLRSVLERLADANIPATVVKGPALAGWAYKQREHRTYTDLDLVVPADEVEPALEVLRGDDRTAAIPPKTPKADKRNIPMVSSEGVRFNLDLHWDLFSYTQLRGCASGATREGWDRATWRPDDPLGPMWRLPEDMLVAFLATHALLDHRFRLILFRDLQEVATRTLDWEAYLDFSLRHRLRSVGYLAWQISASLLDAPVPEGVLRGLRVRSAAVRAAEMMLPRVDPVTFDGHRPHPLNLAIVLLHDQPSIRLRLAAAAPVAYPEWLRRVAPAWEQGRTSRRNGHRDIRRRVLHLLPVDLARGAQTYARTMRDELDGQLVEHRSATLFLSEPASLEADFDLAAPLGRGRDVGFSLRAALRLRRFLRQWRPDVVVAHGGESLKYAAVAAPRRIQLVYYKIGTAEELLSHPWRRRFHRLLARRADAVVGVSRDMVDEAVDILGIDRSATACIPNARDPAVFAEGPDRTDGRPVRFISVGYVNALKRPGWLVSLIRELNARGIACSGIWAGDGPLLESYRHESLVEFMGRRDDIPALLAQSDVFVLTSQAEGMPGVLIEAGMAGLPSVATAAAGVVDVVRDGETGFVVDQDDWEGFLSAAVKLSLDSELRRRMGKAARAYCVDRFSLEASAKAWKAKIDELLAADR